MNICKWHLCKNKTSTIFCSKKCKNKYYVNKRRKTLKQKAVEYMGGKCIICSYNKCLRALTFHHLDPTKKDFNIASKGYTRSWNRIKEELDKCILVCSNCHAEIHEGLLIPSQVLKKEGVDTNGM